MNTTHFEMYILKSTNNREIAQYTIILYYNTNIEAKHANTR